LPLAEKLGVYLNIENIFFNGYLMTPAEMNAFVDGFKSKHVRIHFDTGNIMEMILLFHTLTATMPPGAAPGGFPYVFPNLLQLPAVQFPPAGRGRFRAPPD